MTKDLWALDAVDLGGADSGQTDQQPGGHWRAPGPDEAVNPAVNAVTVPLADGAMAAAAAADQALAAGRSLGPLHGVPFTVKENLDVQGGASTAGVVAFRDNLAPPWGMPSAAPVGIAATEAFGVEALACSAGAKPAGSSLPDMATAGCSGSSCHRVMLPTSGGGGRAVQSQRGTARASRRSRGALGRRLRRHAGC